MKITSVLVTGAGGYVGTPLVRLLLNIGMNVTALDTFWFGNFLQNHDRLRTVKHDLRDPLPADILKDVDAVIHLACISNDPSYELDRKYSDSINIEASRRLIEACAKAGIQRFIFASSSSVYGVKSDESVTEDLSLEPLTPYSESKIAIETFLKDFRAAFDYVILRPATLYGPSPRLRLDLVSNLLTAQAYFNRKITVFGGTQQRPQLALRKMLEVYRLCVSEPSSFAGEIFNVGETNHSVSEIAALISDLFSDRIQVDHVSSNDNRSYRISSEKFSRRFGFNLQSELKTELGALVRYFESNPGIDWQSAQFHNVKNLKSLLVERAEKI